MGNYWFLRLMHRFAARSTRPLEDVVAAEALASSLGPSLEECKTNLDADNFLTYPESVKKRAPTGGWSQMIGLYRDGLAIEPWQKSLETLEGLYNLDGGRRSSSAVGIFEDGPKGKLKTKATIVWGKRDPAIDFRVAIEGIEDYLAKGSQVIILPRAGHWVPSEKDGRAVIEQVLSWAVGGETDDLESRVQTVCQEAKISVQR